MVGRSVTSTSARGTYEDRVSAVLAPREQGKPKLTIPITHREPAAPTLVADFAGVPLWKRGLDICCVLFAIATLLPMLLLIAIGIKLGSKGPLLFKQERVGLFGKRFIVVKFRTMMADFGHHSS